MTSEERITQLEQEVADLKEHAGDTRNAYLTSLGTSRAFEIAVLSLLASTKHPEGVAKDLAERLQHLETQLIFESPSEEQVHGAQCASEALILALGDAQTLAAPSLPATQHDGAAAPCEAVGLLH